MMTNHPASVIFGFFTDTWNDAVERGLMRPPERMVLAMVDDPRVGRLMVADPMRFVGAQMRRKVLRDGLAPLPPRANDKAVLHRPRRMLPRRPEAGRGLRRDVTAQSDQMRRAARRAGMVAPAIITCDPIFAGLAPLGWASTVTYYARDDWAAHHALPHLSAAIMNGYRGMRLNNHNVVAVSQPLFDAIGVPHGTVVPNGITPEEWRALGAPPAWFTALPEPRLVYTGSLDRRLDAAFVRQAVQATEGGTVVLVGPVEDATHVAALSAITGVMVHGPVGRRELVAVVGGADACVIPHEDSGLTRAMSPLKLYEYLAAGRPVVATDLSPIRGVHDRVVLVPPGGDFAAGVRRALAGGPLSEDDRNSFIEANSWRSRYEDLIRVAVPEIARSGEGAERR